MENILTEKNATEEEMLEALEKGYIKDWRLPPELDWQTKFSMGIEFLRSQLGA